MNSLNRSIGEPVIIFVIFGVTYCINGDTNFSRKFNIFCTCQAPDKGLFFGFIFIIKYIFEVSVFYFNNFILKTVVLKNENDSILFTTKRFSQCGIPIKKVYRVIEFLEGITNFL